MDDRKLHAELLALDNPLGEQERTLLLGEESILIRGLNSELAGQLQLRWGPFLREGWEPPPFFTLQLYSGGQGGWLGRVGSGERYRIEPVNSLGCRVVLSYNFAIGAEAEPRSWRAAVNASGAEPPGIVVENILRYLTARMAIERGGLAMHAAGLLCDGRAYLFAGVSRTGKSTVARLSEFATSLGDDMAMVVQDRSGWCAAALPFDNAERVQDDAIQGLHPLAGIWRLHQSNRHRVERPRSILGVASLLACAAFPWAYPELSERLLGQVASLVDARLFAHLHFRKDAGFWDLLR